MHCSPGNQWSRRHWHPLPANIATPPVRAVLNSRLKRENETRDCSTAFRQSSQRGWHKKCIDTKPSKRPSPAQGLLAGMVLIYPRLFAGSWITQPWQAVATPSFRSTCRAPSGNPSSPSSKASSTYRCWQHEYHMCDCSGLLPQKDFLVIHVSGAK